MRKTLSVLLPFLFFTPALAGDLEILQCGGVDSVRNIAGPLKNSTRTFANGKIRVWHVDTGGEPVCCSSHLVILAPDPDDELGFAQCKVLSSKGSLGFQWLRVSDIKSSYDVAKGLLLSVPVERYIDGMKSKKETVRVRVNQATGAITIE